MKYSTLKLLECGILPRFITVKHICTFSLFLSLHLFKVWIDLEQDITDDYAHDRFVKRSVSLDSIRCIKEYPDILVTVDEYFCF